MLPKNVWIVDTGVSDHMASSASYMTKYMPCTTSIEISMADGTISPVMGFGTICISGLKLKSVLHVPSLQCNLLSVHKITRDMNCYVTFFPSYCLFQDQASKRMIGNARARDNLYYLVEDTSVSAANKASLTVTTNAKILLWHKRLGHPSFPYLQFLYP